MKSNDLIKECLSGQIKEEAKITGSIIKDFVKDPFIIYCDRFAPVEEKDPESAFLSVLAQKGVEHEDKIKITLFPELEPLTIEDPVEAFMFAIKSMFQGICGLTNFPFFYVPMSLEGHIDILRKNNSHESIFGNYYYEVYEVKVAKHIKEYHIMQAAFYNYLIGLIQKYEPPRFYVINKEGTEYSYNYDKYKKLLIDTIKQIKKVRNNEYHLEPIYGSDCFPWTNYCNKIALEKRDLSIIPGIGSKKRELLMKAGFITIEQVYSANINRIISIKSFGKKTANRIKLHAQSFLENKIIHLKEVNVKRYNKEVFIDLEGFDPTSVPEGVEPIDFLFGVLVKEESNLYYHDFIILDPFDNGHCIEIFEKFLEFLSSIPDAPIYHWGSYDRSRVLKQYDTYNITNFDIDSLIKRFIDLSAIVKQSFIFPIPSYSLKQLAPYLGFNWRTSQMTGREAVVKYLEYLNDEFRDKSVLKEMINYNEDDLYALLTILNWITDDKNH